MKKARITHQVIRTKNKHSRAVLKDNTVVIRLARNLSKTEERDHIRDLLRRMTRIVLEERTKTVIHPFQSLLEGASRTTLELYSGKELPFSLVAGSRTVAERINGAWRVSVSSGSRRRGLHRLFWKALSRSEEESVRTLVQRINAETYRVRIADVRLRFTTSQWGSCSPRGLITINTALLVLPERLLRYIIIHELAHRIHPDHSQAFWNTVQRAMPDFEDARRELMEYRLPAL